MSLTLHGLRKFRGKIGRAVLGERYFAGAKSLAEVPQMKVKLESLHHEVDDLKVRHEKVERSYKMLKLQHSELEQEYAQYLRMNLNLVEIKQPLILISQIQRSGGTLMSQLFDNHPQCHAHPYELEIGYPKKFNWPDLNLAQSPLEWFNLLNEAHISRSFREGYKKYSRFSPEDYEKLPFKLLPSLQKYIFLECASSENVQTDRDIINAYMTSYFNAWLDNGNLEGEKKYVTGFVPRMHMTEHNMEKFFSIYPDGYLISIVRDPRSWYVSARKHKPNQYGEISQGVSLWKQSSNATLRAKEKYGSRVLVVSFEELVTDTEKVMSGLARTLGIEFLPTLIEQTFNGNPIRDNSAFPQSGHGFKSDPLERYKVHLNEADRGYIEAQALSLYETVKALSHLD